MHANEIPLSVDQVRGIVSEQFPQWRDLPIAPVDGSGTVNRIFRLGNDLAARFPLVVDNPDDVLEYLGIEAEAERELLGRTRFPTPAPVALGHASPDYPGPWAVQTWLPGRVAAEVDLSRSDVLAHDIAQFINEVRNIPTRGRPYRGYGRGGHLQVHDEWIETCFAHSEGLVDVPRLRILWNEMRELPPATGDVMTHGDILPTNLLVRGEALVGVLDVGGLGPGDPALDLMGVWSLFDNERRQLVRDELTCTDLEWARGQAWAFQQGMGAVWYYVDSNPTMSQMGRRTLEHVVRHWAE